VNYRLHYLEITFQIAPVEPPSPRPNNAISRWRWNTHRRTGCPADRRIMREMQGIEYPSQFSMRKSTTGTMGCIATMMSASAIQTVIICAGWLDSGLFKRLLCRVTLCTLGYTTCALTDGRTGVSCDVYGVSDRVTWHGNASTHTLWGLCIGLPWTWWVRFWWWEASLHFLVSAANLMLYSHLQKHIMYHSL